MEALVILLFFALLAFAAPRWGQDTHRNGEWGPDGLAETWRRPDRHLPRTLGSRYRTRS